MVRLCRHDPSVRVFIEFNEGGEIAPMQPAEGWSVFVATGLSPPVCESGGFMMATIYAEYSALIDSVLITALALVVWAAYREMRKRNHVAE